MINNNYYLSIDDKKIENNYSILCYIVIQKCPVGHFLLLLSLDS